jgi:D-alanine-D-alanine ligase-like ATP-grasp enzyme
MKIYKINEVNAISKHAVIIMKPELAVENLLVDAIIRKIAIVQREAFHRMPKIFRLKNNSFGVEIITSSILDLILNYATNLVRTYKRNSTLVHRINVVDQNIKTKLKKIAHSSVFEFSMRYNVPIEVVTHSSKPLFALGHGVHRRLFWKNFTSQTTEVGTVFSTQKHVMAQMLASAGLPVPPQIVTKSLQEAHRAAIRLGWPIAVKPLSKDFGIGVTSNVKNAQQLDDAYFEAAKFGAVLVQKHINGNGHRLLIHNGKCIAGVCQKPASITGNGQSSIGELIRLTNKNRSEKISKNFKKINIDQALLNMLKQKNYSIDSVPQKGEVVLLRPSTNLSQGGTIIRTTDQIHPLNKLIAETAAMVFGIDLAGVDIQAKDISMPITETGGAIIEVNPTPGLVMLEDGTSLEDQIYFSYVDQWDLGKIPVILCLESEATYAKYLFGILSKEKMIALAESRNISIQEGATKLVRQTASVQDGIKIAIQNPRTKILIISCTEIGALNFGIGLQEVSLLIDVDRSGRKLPNFLLDICEYIFSHDDASLMASSGNFTMVSELVTSKNCNNEISIGERPTLKLFKRRQPDVHLNGIQEKSDNHAILRDIIKVVSNEAL